MHASVNMRTQVYNRSKRIQTSVKHSMHACVNMQASESDVKYSMCPSKTQAQKVIFFNTMIIKVQLWAWSGFVAVKSFTRKVIFFITMVIKVQL